MSYPTEEIRRRIIELILLSLERELSSDELQELRDCFEKLGSLSPEEMSKEVMDPSWLKESYQIMEKIERSKEETLKRIWDAIKDGG